jgi:hypothetical protein
VRRAAEVGRIEAFTAARGRAEWIRSGHPVRLHFYPWVGLRDGPAEPWRAPGARLEIQKRAQLRAARVRA